MVIIASFLRWGWVLGLALLLPVALPAGGCEPRKHVICRRKSSGTLLAINQCALRAVPFSKAPILSNLDVGTPLRIVRSWTSEDGEYWLQVQIKSGEIVGFNSSARRGWVNV